MARSRKARLTSIEKKLDKKIELKKKKAQSKKEVEAAARRVEAKRKALSKMK